MITKRIVIASIITLVVATAMAIIGFSTFYGQHYIDVEGAGLSGYRGTELYSIQPNSDYDIKQLLVASQPRLARITIPIESQKNSRIRLTLTAETGQAILRETTLPIPQATVAVPITWTFAPLDDSTGKNYWLEMSGHTGETVQKFLTIDPARYDGGELLINGGPQTGQRLVVDWQYYTPHFWRTAIERLAYAKPGIWGHQTTIIILIVILYICTMGVVAWLTFTFITDDPDHTT
ncbi:MAG: hypothetical protein V1668_00090 [Patescibacteria group bacterium]